MLPARLPLLALLCLPFTDLQAATPLFTADGYRIVGHLYTFTHGDSTRPLVVYCRADCRNAGKRAANLGYTSVYGYRNGPDARQAAKLPATAATPGPVE